MKKELKKLEYPRPVTLDNPKLKKLLEEKAEMVMQGRELSQEIEEIEEEMKLIDQEIREQEGTAEIKDIKEKAIALTDQYNAVMKDMEALKKEMYERAKKKVDPKLIKAYEDKKKLKEDKEKERNKKALKVGKWNDKIIPRTQEAMKPYLQDEYDDYYGITLENGELIGTIFNHKIDFEKRFKEKVNNKYRQ
jgi:hypothetical protein